MAITQNSNLDAVNRIVAIGGGHGLGRIMSALSFIKDRLTGIVTTTDNGGSTGRIRDTQGGIAWGDLRNCLNQIITEPSTASALFEYRFSGDGELAGHNLGNLMLKALEDMHIRPLDAVNLIRDLLHVRSYLIPMSELPVHLAATLQSGLTVVGETNIDNLRELPTALSLVPEVKAPQEALTALEQAEVILFGPGSFLTSIMPPLLLPEIQATLRRSRAKKIFIDNLGIEYSPAAALSLTERINWLNRTVGRENLIDGVIMSDKNYERFFAQAPSSEEISGKVGGQNSSDFVTALYKPAYKIIGRRLNADDVSYRHDRSLLCAAIDEMLEELDKN